MEVHSPPWKRLKLDGCGTTRSIRLGELFHWTFRLEQHDDRFLIFRSDRRGAIAKAVYHDSKLHVLEVKAPYRGLDFGGLLFGSVVGAVCKQQAMQGGILTLDAEEDTNRHNKLVQFYQRLGCRIKANSKIIFINNNDSQTFRKVPMYRELPQESSALPKHHVALENLGVFRSVNFCTRNDERLDRVDDNDRLVSFMIVQHDGHVCLQTTTGWNLVVDDTTVRLRGRDVPPTRFDLQCISDMDNNCQSGLLMIRCLEDRGLYLFIRNEELAVSRSPGFWKTQNDHDWVCTMDTPQRRRHYLKSWKMQSIQFVQLMQEKYLGFDSRALSLRDALERVAELPAYPWRERCHLNLRTRCFYQAEMFRHTGHPDWIQFLGLVYHLGQLLHTEDDYDWTLSARSRVLGCPTADNVVFHEFKTLNPEKTVYSSATGMYEPHCGLNQTVLTWTGPEYMYWMLKHNNVTIPGEGLQMLRLASLSDWHGSNRDYADLADDKDGILERAIADFDELMKESVAEVDYSPEECAGLWETHYKCICHKYNAAHILEW